MQHRREFARVARCAASIALAAGATQAAVIRWTSAGGGVFAIGANWQGGVTPGPVDDAIFDLANAYTVQFPGSVETSTATVRAGSVTFSGSSAATYFSGALIVGDTVSLTPTLTVTGGVLQPGIVSIGAVASAAGVLNIQQTGTVVAESDFNVGDAASGTLSVTGGGTARAAGVSLASRTGGAGTLSIDGAGSLVEATTQATLGLRGPASVSISGGGSLISRGAMVVGAIAGQPATVTATGAASKITAEGQLTVGSAGSATVSITDGALATGPASIADNLDSSGSLTISGASAVWTLAGLLQVGRNATGALTVTSGAVVNGNAAMFVGAFAGAGTARFAGGGTAVSTPAQFQVGSETSGNLTIEGGATLTSGTQGSASGTSGLLGQLNAGDGRVTITGAGSAWTQTGALAVGWSASGRLDILAGGRASSASGFVGRNVGGVGAVTVSGTNSRWNNTGDLRVGLDPAGLNSGASTLAITAGGAVQAANVRVGSQATVSGNGRIEGSLISAGTVAPGIAGTPGALAVTGSYTQSATGRLAIEIGGAGQNDRLSVSGAASLAGTLAVTLLNNYSPPVGASFTVLQAATAAGAFASTSFPSLSGGRSFQAIVQGGAVLVRVVGPCNGDINGDGMVNFADLNVCLAGYGTLYDFNTLASILGNYGNAC